MPLWPVHFRYMTGLTGAILPGVNARLHGSWDGAGYYFDAWGVRDRQRAVADDSCRRTPRRPSDRSRSSLDSGDHPTRALENRTGMSSMTTNPWP